MLDNVSNHSANSSSSNDNNNNTRSHGALTTASSSAAAASATAEKTPSPSKEKHRARPARSGSGVGSNAMAGLTSTMTSTKSTATTTTLNRNSKATSPFSSLATCLTVAAIILSIIQIVTFQPLLLTADIETAIGGMSGLSADEVQVVLLSQRQWKLQSKSATTTTSLERKTLKNENSQEEKEKDSMDFNQQQQQQQQQDENANDHDHDLEAGDGVAVLEHQDESAAADQENQQQLQIQTENPIRKTLAAAHVPVQEEQIDGVPVDLDGLWKNMTMQYGSLHEPILIGWERCDEYRKAVPAAYRYAAPAGMFNTGTNALQFQLQHNLAKPPSLGHSVLGPDGNAKWQIPWGKHRMAAVRLKHRAPGMEDINQEQGLPVVMIRDPFHWMQSMCKSPYAANWRHEHASGKHCPNLVPSPEEYEQWKHDVRVTPDSFKVNVVFDKDNVLHWDSLVHLWSDWYKQYLTDATYPRLMIRMEDLLLHGPKILQAISECMYGDLPTTEWMVPPEKFKYQVHSAKSHGSGTDFFMAIAKTGDAQQRVKHLTKRDLEFAAQHLDSELLETFHYILPPIPNTTETSTTTIADDHPANAPHRHAHHQQQHHQQGHHQHRRRRRL